MSLTLQEHYKTITNNSQFGVMREYITPALHVDPRQQVLDRKNADYKNKPRQTKFKAIAKHKPCFMDQHIEPFVPNPSPDKYKTLTKQFFGEPQSDEKSVKRTKSASLLKKVDPKLIKNTYIDSIEKYQTKNKEPGVGKYDITKDPYKKKYLNLKQKQKPIKFDNLDDVKFLSNGVPGAGFYNPHLSVPHLNPNRTDYKFYKSKHEQEQKKRKKLIQTKLGPSTYEPIKANTFDAFSKNKNKERSRWSHGSIDIRKGLRAEYKSPSPAEYKLLNQWSARNPRQRESELGKVKLFQRTTRSTKAFSVYN